MKRKKIFLISLVVLMLGANISSAQLFEKLEITAPENAAVNEEITIKVTAGGNPVEDATVSIDGIPLNEKTNSNGQIKHTFSVARMYTIRVSRSGYLLSDPHFIKIEAQPLQPLLVVTTDPITCNAGDEVTITVKANHLPVEGATISVKEVIGETYNAIDKTTNSNGQVKYIFNEGGTYLIKANRDGYTESHPYTLKVLDIELPECIPISGAVFPVPDSLEEEISAQLTYPYSSLLAVTDKLFIVFSKTPIEKGLANVMGQELTGITWREMKIGAILAKDVSVEQEGMEVTIDEIKSNPDKYALKLVKIKATLRQVPLLIDLDDESDFQIPITVGRVAENPLNPMDFTNLPEKTYEFDRNRNRGYLEQMLNLSKAGLSIFDFETNYLVDCNATVNAIVLSPAVVKEFIGAMAGTEIGDLVIPAVEDVVLYNVKTDLESIDTSIKEIKAYPEKYMDKVVTFEGSDVGVNVSIQETLRETQETPPPVDLLLHGTIIWYNPPPAVEEIQTGTLMTIGVSSRHQDTAVESVNGALEILRYTGKVVSAKQINETLNNIMLVLYEREKIGDISVEEIISEAKERIQEKILAIRYILQRKTPEIVYIPVILSEKPEVIEIAKGDVKSITLNLRNKVENVSISVLKMEEKPSEVTINASGEVYAYLEINAENISDEDVKNVIIEFKVNRSWVVEANVDEKSVRLSRYSNGSWSILSTSIVGESSTEIYYSAESPGLSIYAITGEKVEEKVGKGTPGFELVVAVVAMILILFCKRKVRIL